MLDEGGLATAGTAHEVDPEYPVFFEMGTVVVGLVVVFVENFFDDRDGLGIIELRIVVEVFMRLLVSGALIVVIVVVMVMVIVVMVMMIVVVTVTVIVMVVIVCVGVSVNCFCASDTASAF
jgi:hypothetical protein